MTKVNTVSLKNTPLHKHLACFRADVPRLYLLGIIVKRNIGFQYQNKTSQLIKTEVMSV